MERFLGMGLRVTQRLLNARTLLFGAPNADFEDIIRRVRPFTMTTAARVTALCDALSYVLQHHIPGAFVECGVWRGGSSMAAALRLMQLGERSRALYLFDTYAGMTEPDSNDRSRISGFSAAQILKFAPANSKIVARATLDDVRQNMYSTGYPQDFIHLIEGPVERTVPDAAPEQIAVLRLDTDWYKSTKHELIHLFPRISTGGVLIIDDYGDWSGAQQATDEYIREAKLKIFLHRIDHTGRLAIKQCEK